MTYTTQKLGCCIKSTEKQKSIICQSDKSIFCSQSEIENILNVLTQKMYYFRKRKIIWKLMTAAPFKKVGTVATKSCQSKWY